MTRGGLFLMAMTEEKRAEAQQAEGKRRRLSPLLWLSSLGAIALLALGITGTLGQFVARITNTNNEVETAGPESFGFEETNVVDGTPDDEPCAVAPAGGVALCSEINKFGQMGGVATPISPGESRTTEVRLRNTASTDPLGLSGDLTLVPSACSQQPPVDLSGEPPVGDLCAVITVTINCDSPSGVPFALGPVTLDTFFTGAPADGYVIELALPPGDEVNCTFLTEFPFPNADPSLQGITADQVMQWVFTQTEP